MKNSRLKVLCLLHVLLMVYSTGGIFSKLAAGEQGLTIRFIFYYGMIIFWLGVYAIGWQQMIKRLPLTTAFANKAVTVVWGIVWGAIFFHEAITIGKFVGAILVIVGVVLFALSDQEEGRI